MAHPKRRQGSTRRDKRRSHHHAVAQQISICPVTGQDHLSHRAYWHEGKLYYRGKVVIDKSEPEKA